MKVMTPMKSNVRNIYIKVTHQNKRPKDLQLLARSILLFSDGNLKLNCTDVLETGCRKNVRQHTDFRKEGT